MVDLHTPGVDEWRWLRLHGQIEGRGDDLRFECRCTALTPEGRCGIYAERPQVCRTYPPGGQDCLDTVRRRRTAEEYQRIRDAGDPERLA